MLVSRFERWPDQTQASWSWNRPCQNDKQMYLLSVVKYLLRWIAMFVVLHTVLWVLVCVFMYVYACVYWVCISVRKLFLYINVYFIIVGC